MNKTAALARLRDDVRDLDDMAELFTISAGRNRRGRYALAAKLVRRAALILDAHLSVEEARALHELLETS